MSDDGGGLQGEEVRWGKFEGAVHGAIGCGWGFPGFPRRKPATKINELFSHETNDGNAWGGCKA